MKTALTLVIGLICIPIGCGTSKFNSKKSGEMQTPAPGLEPKNPGTQTPGVSDSEQKQTSDKSVLPEGGSQEDEGEPTQLPQNPVGGTGGVVPGSQLHLAGCTQQTFHISASCAAGTVASGIGYNQGVKLECCRVEDAAGNAMNVVASSPAVTQSWRGGRAACGVDQFITSIARSGNSLTLGCAEVTSGSFRLRTTANETPESYVIRSDQIQFQRCNGGKLMTAVADSVVPDMDTDYVECLSVQVSH